MIAKLQVKELLLVLDSIRPPGCRLKTLAATAAVLAGCGLGRAQTAPQLLPYTAKLIAGGGTAIKAGAKCPSSGYTSLDAYGDGCLATEVLLSSPRYAVTDTAGNVFLSDYTSSLIRRVDATTGIITLVGGGPTTSPTTGTTCGSNTALDNKGDGCLATLVNLYNPVDLKFAANGDLYFVESGNADVRKITATNGLIPTTGVISLVAGNAALKTAGYAVDQGATQITVGPGSTTSYLDFPGGLAFDAAGNLYIADEGNEALEVVNLTSATETIQGVSVAPGTIAKIAGYGAYQTKSTTVECPNGLYTNSTNRGGCYFGTYSNTTATPATKALLDAPYAVALDPSGNVYFDNEFIQGVGLISGGSLTNYAGINGSFALYTAAKPYPRAAAGSFAIGSNFGLAVDANSNAYITDNLNGVVWRVDGAGKSMYVVAGGLAGNTTAGTACPATSTAIATDTYGDGCPATQATFGKNGTSYSSTGVYGVTVDANSNLFLGDSVTNLVREVSSNTQFGQVGGVAVTQTLEVHFAAGDVAAANGYTLTNGSANFTLGSTSCTLNSDTTTDCLLPVTAAIATSANLGAFSGTLKVTSTLGGVGTFTLSGTHVSSPVTRTGVGITASTNCTGTTTYSTTTPITLTATITSTGSPTGTVQFYANNAAIGSPVNVSNSVATLTYTFSTPNTYAITAQYSGDSQFNGSTGASATTVTSSTPSLGTTLVESPIGGSVVQGQTAAYSFSLAQNVYTGTVSFSVSGLPANSTATFSPSTISATGCSTTGVVTMTIATSLASIKQAGFGGAGPWRLGLMLTGVLLAGVLAVRRRSLRGSWPRLTIMLALLVASSGLMACGKAGQTGVSTPTGTYTLVVKATGSDGTSSSMSTSLTVTAYQDIYH